MRTGILIAVALVTLCQACSSAPKTWGNGYYRDLAQDQSQPYSYRDTLTEFDEEKMFSGAIAQLEACQSLPLTSRKFHYQLL